MEINKIYQGDCLEVMKDIPDGSIDMVLCDPPYGTTACKWDTVIPFEPMWKLLNKVIKKNAAICLFGAEPFSSALRMSNIKNYKYDWIWEKDRPTGFALAKKQPMKYHEIISVFYNCQCLYKQIKGIGKKNHSCSKGNKNTDDIMNAESQPSIKKIRVDISGLKYPKSIIYFQKGGSTTFVHPTQKPVALMEYLIKTYTNENETVLDFTMGSGTTCVACKKTNRNYIGIELDKKYFEIAKKRIQNTKLGLDVIHQRFQKTNEHTLNISEGKDK